MSEDRTDEITEKPAPAARRIPLISVAALALSMLALFVSVLEVSAMRDEQRFQVWPYVEVSTRYSADGYAIIATNKGIGPARIRTAELWFDGQPVESLDELIVSTLGESEAFSYDLYKSSNPARSVMSANETAQLFAVPWEDRTRKLSAIWNDRVSVTLCYCSVYDECWRSALDGGEPVVVETCPGG